MNFPFQSTENSKNECVPIIRMYKVGKASEAASYLELDAVIDPAATRAVVLRALAAAGKP